MNGKKKWIYPIIAGVIISIAAYAAARDNKLTETVTRTDHHEKKLDQLEKKDANASAERKEIIKAQQKTNEQLASFNAILKALAAKEGIRYD